MATPAVGAEAPRPQIAVAMAEPERSEVVAGLGEAGFDAFSIDLDAPLAEGFPPGHGAPPRRHRRLRQGRRRGRQRRQCAPRPAPWPVRGVRHHRPGPRRPPGSRHRPGRRADASAIQGRRAALAPRGDGDPGPGPDELQLGRGPLGRPRRLRLVAGRPGVRRVQSERRRRQDDDRHEPRGRAPAPQAHERAAGRRRYRHGSCWPVAGPPQRPVDGRQLGRRGRGLRPRVAPRPRDPAQLRHPRRRAVDEPAPSAEPRAGPRRRRDHGGAPRRGRHRGRPAPVLQRGQPRDLRDRRSHPRPGDAGPARHARGNPAQGRRGRGRRPRSPGDDHQPRQQRRGRCRHGDDRLA